MQKPIFIIKFPSDTSIEGFASFQESSLFKDKEYYILLVENTEYKWEFEMYSSEKINPIKLKELEEKLFKQIKNKYEGENNKNIKKA
jgi:hypothetical protein